MSEIKTFKDEKHKEKIIDRIRKILALANGTSFEGEANTAMTMAQNYMKTYGLSMTDVELGESLDEPIVHELVDRQKPMKTWEGILAVAVGTVTDCRPVRVSNSVLSFIGYKQDVDMAKMLFSMLREATRRAGRKLYPNDTAMRRSFYLGVADRLAERAKAEKQTNTTDNTRYALVVQEKSTRVNSWIDQNKRLTQSRMRQQRVHGSAYEEGRRHANSMDLGNRTKVAQSGLNIGYTR